MTLREFEVTFEHLLLLRATWVDWNYAEFGAPSIDPKRPYGNSAVLDDIAELLGIDREAGKDEPFSPKQVSRMARLHLETATALQIALSVGYFEPGWYHLRSLYGKDWRPGRAELVRSGALKVAE